MAEQLAFPNHANVGIAERIASAAAGSLLVAWGLRKHSVGRIAGAILGADLIYRGLSGQCKLYSALRVSTARKAKSGSQVSPSAPVIERSITIGKSPEELFEFWREPENLSRIMAHFAEVTPVTEGFSHWKVRGPLRQVFEWDSSITSEQPGRMLAWESLPGASLPNRGEVSFRPGNGFGTEVNLRMQFEPPLGALGAGLAKTMQKVPRAVAGKALRRFKSLVETGEIPTLEHNPSGRGSSDLF
ncbi:MAG: DUF2892 domain-containing protein [Bryobacterales bacterium]|nr:DUF2892 domain-containing protein [Bryobacterales bacterium]